MNIERTNRNVWIGLAFVLVGVLALSGMAGGMMEHGSPGGYGERSFMGPGPWMWGVGFLGLVVRFAILGGLIFLAVNMFRRWSAHSGGHLGHSDVSSLEILRRRYAAGEITREQFEDMRRVLTPEAQ